MEEEKIFLLFFENRWSRNKGSTSSPLPSFPNWFAVSQPSYRKRQRKGSWTNDWNNQADQIPRSTPYWPVSKCMRAQVCRRGFGGGTVRQIYAGLCVYAGRGVRVCRLMDSGAGARDWLQCRSRALCPDAQRVHRPRNIISADWHFAFATINIAPRPRNFEFYRDDFVRFPRRCELYIYIYKIRFARSWFAARNLPHRVTILSNRVLKREDDIAWIIEIVGIVQIDTIVSIRVSIFSE